MKYFAYIKPKILNTEAWLSIIRLYHFIRKILRNTTTRQQR